MNAVIGWAYFGVIHLALPCLFIWGLIRGYRSSNSLTLAYSFSLVGFLFALTSQMLDFASVAYAHEIGGFAYYAPELMRIFRWGDLLALVALIFAMCGAWRRNPLRWHALGCSLGMLVLWFGAAMAE